MDTEQMKRGKNGKESGHEKDQARSRVEEKKQIQDGGGRSDPLTEDCRVIYLFWW